MNSRIILISILILWTCGSTYGINSDKNYVLTPDSIGWDYEELRIWTEDNIALNTWIYAPNPQADKSTVLVLAYPDAGNMSYFVYHAATLANGGFTVVTFDYRGFGKSSDFEINPDYLYYLEFSKDLEAVVSKMSKKFSNKRMGIWSQSMGTIVAARAYPNIKEEIDFIIGEGFITKTASIVERYQEKGKKLILPETEIAYSQVVGQIDIPLLILAASKDEITTTSDALEFKVQLGKTCEVVEYEGGHLHGFQYKIDDIGFGGWYLEQISTFIERR